MGLLSTHVFYAAFGARGGGGGGGGVSMGSMSDIMLTCPCSKTGVFRCIFILIFALKHR